MKHIYCISGLGADERVFAKFQFAQHEIHFIKWMTPEKNESIEKYAKRLLQQIQHTNPILIGLSFGGLMCIEIAKQTKIEAVIIISSIKNLNELPLWMRISAKLKLNKLFPVRSFKLIEPLENFSLGVKTQEEKLMVEDYRKNIDPVYSDWAINAILNWKNKTIPENTYHIHGNMDKIFSIKKVKANYTIQGGEHLMILNKSEEVNACINSILSKHLN